MIVVPDRYYFTMNCCGISKLLFFSNETCSLPHEECRDIIPYTTYPNQLYELNTTEEYAAFNESIWMALDNCTMDPYFARWGVCTMMYPRCLQGWELQFCRQSCLGIYMYIFDSMSFNVERPRLLCFGLFSVYITNAFSWLILVLKGHFKIALKIIRLWQLLDSAIKTY